MFDLLGKIFVILIVLLVGGVFGALWLLSRPWIQDFLSFKIARWTENILLDDVKDRA